MDIEDICPWCGDELYSDENGCTYDEALGEHVNSCDTYKREQNNAQTR